MFQRINLINLKDSIFHGLGKLHHYSFAHEVNVRMDNKLQVAIFKIGSSKSPNVKQATKNTPTHPLIQHMDPVQAMTTAIHNII